MSLFFFFFFFPEFFFSEPAPCCLELKPRSHFYDYMLFKICNLCGLFTEHSRPFSQNENTALWIQILSLLTYSGRQWTDHIHGLFSPPVDWALSADLGHSNQMETDEESYCISWKQHQTLTWAAVNPLECAVRNKIRNKDGDRVEHIS